MIDRNTLDSYYLSFDDTRDLGRGTAFPASADLPGGLQASDRFFRTDLGFACFWDGARWLTQNEYCTVFPGTDTAAANAFLGGLTRTRIDYVAYYTRIAITTRVLTTNNGTNFWTVSLVGYNLDFSASTTIVAVSTNGDAVGAYVDRETAATSPGTGNNRFHLTVAASVTGAPGTLRAIVTAYYRLVVT